MIYNNNIRLLNLIFKRFTYNRSYTSDELSLWVEQSQDLMQRSTASFLIVTNSGPFLSFGHLFKLNFFLAHFYSSPVYSVHAVYLFCNWHSLNTNYFGTIFGGVPGSFNSDKIKCVCSQNRPWFKVPSEWLHERWATNPLLKVDYAMTIRNRVFCYHYH